MANDDPIGRLAEALDRAAPGGRGAAFEATEVVTALAGSVRAASERSADAQGLLSQQANSQIARLVDSLDQAQSIQQVYVQTQAQHTSAILQSTMTKTNSTESSGSRGAAGVFDAVVNRFILSPIAGAILGLFGGRDNDPPTPLPTYTLPSAIRINAGYSASSEGASRAVDYGQDGLPRVIQTPAPVVAPQITVQVQALDSRSFLDHSEDIALAVRHAVLNSHALADVVSEL
jgi:hypothetical protein